jgi:hypothetical protein
MALSTQNREAALLRATTDLFVHGGQHTSDEIQRFEELALHFLPKVLVSDRAYVAESLADRVDAPAAVLTMLGKDLVEVAAPILKRAKNLSASDLIGVISETGPLHHRMIAARRDLPPEVAKELRLRQDAVTVALLDRPAIAAPARQPEPESSVVPFGPAAGDIMGPLPYDRDDTEFADGREESQDEAEDPSEEFFDFPAPTDELDARAEVEVNEVTERFLDMDPAGRRDALASLAHQGVQPPRLTPREQFDIALNAAQKAGQIPALARSKRKEALVSAFADGLGLERALVERMIDDPSGEPLVLLVKAIGLSDAEARQVLLLANPAIGYAVKTFFRLADLHASMEPTVAESMVAAWRGDPAAVHEPQKHVPYVDDSEGVRRRTSQSERRPSRRDAETVRRREG